MTIMTKNGTAVKKVEIIRVPLDEDNLCDEDKIEVHRVQDWVGPRYASRAFVCISFTSMILVLALTTGLLLYRQYSKPPTHRYQGYCSIPMPVDIREESQYSEPNYRVLPVRWASEPDVHVVSTLDDKATTDFVNALREELDIGDTVEKIGVIDNGRRVNFIHDFSENITGIVDSERCFVMELEPELVVSPVELVAGLTRGVRFDVSPVRSALQALLPALPGPTSQRLADACSMRPIYRLSRDEDVLIRKRSTDDPPHDYIHFSGNHVQEIKINNLQEVLNYEQQHKKV